MTEFKARYPMLVGIALLVLGFLYEALFNGIPYPDPTPEMTERWQFNELVAWYFYLAGVVFLAVGLAMLIFRKFFPPRA